MRTDDSKLTTRLDFQSTFSFYTQSHPCRTKLYYRGSYYSRTGILLF